MAKKDCINCQRNQGGRDCYRQHQSGAKGCSHFKEIVNPYHREKEEKKQEVGTIFDYGIKKTVVKSTKPKK